MNLTYAGGLPRPPCACPRHVGLLSSLLCGVSISFLRRQMRQGTSRHMHNAHSHTWGKWSAQCSSELRETLFSLFALIQEKQKAPEEPEKAAKEEQHKGRGGGTLFIHPESCFGPSSTRGVMCPSKSLQSGFLHFYAKLDAHLFHYGEGTCLRCGQHYSH